MGKILAHAWQELCKTGRFIHKHWSIICCVTIVALFITAYILRTTQPYTTSILFSIAFLTLAHTIMMDKMTDGITLYRSKKRAQWSLGCTWIASLYALSITLGTIWIILGIVNICHNLSNPLFFTTLSIAIIALIIDVCVLRRSFFWYLRRALWVAIMATAWLFLYFHFPNVYGPNTTILNKIHFIINNDKSSFTIPNNTTEIADKAFLGHRNLTSIIIPNSIIKIGAWAFYDCWELTSIYCSAIVPPSTTEGCHICCYNYDCKVYVPHSAVNDYKSAKAWSAYANNIVGYDF